MKDIYTPKYKSGDWVYYTGFAWKIDVLIGNDVEPAYALHRENSSVVTILNCKKNDPYLKKI